jgi:hypothetical protein
MSSTLIAILLVVLFACCVGPLLFMRQGRGSSADDARKGAEPLSKLVPLR